MNLREVFHDNSIVRGFTLIELLLVLSLTLIITTFMFPVGLSFYRSQMLSETTEGLASTLRRAQSFALTGRHESPFGVRISPDAYVLFEGASYASRTTSEDESFPIASAISISGFTEVVFSERSGAPSVTGVLLLTAHNRERFIEILPSGNIE